MTRPIMLLALVCLFLAACGSSHYNAGVMRGFNRSYYGQPQQTAPVFQPIPIPGTAVQNQNRNCPVATWAPGC